MSFGTIIKVIGPVVDIEFAHDDLPKLDDALRLVKGELVFEVQKRINDNVVRTIAMGNTNDLRSGVQVQNTGEPVKVILSQQSFTRMMAVLSKPTTEELVAVEELKPFHHQPIGATLADAREIMDQGIKLIYL